MGLDESCGKVVSTQGDYWSATFSLIPRTVLGKLLAGILSPELHPLLKEQPDTDLVGHIKDGIIKQACMTSGGSLHSSATPGAVQTQERRDIISSLVTFARNDPLWRHPVNRNHSSWRNSVDGTVLMPVPSHWAVLPPRQPNTSGDLAFQQSSGTAGCIRWQPAIKCPELATHAVAQALVSSLSRQPSHRCWTF